MDIDLNADLGEGAGTDAALMPLITSANVCCGAHAGGPTEIRKALYLAQGSGVVVGAHPGYPDRENFGRKPVAMQFEELIDSLQYQIGGLWGLSQLTDVPARYVKPHGALYHAACADEGTAKLVASTARGFDLPVVGLPESALERECRRFGPPFIPEGFADRRYRPDGSLAPRSEPDAFVHDPREAVEQVEWLIRERGVRTVCVHGDNPDAVAFVEAVRAALLDRGHRLKAFA